MSESLDSEIEFESELEDQEVIAAQQLLWQQMQEQQKLKFGRSPFTIFTAASYHEGEQWPHVLLSITWWSGGILQAGFYTLKCCSQFGGITDGAAGIEDDVQHL